MIIDFAEDTVNIELAYFRGFSSHTTANHYFQNSNFHHLILPPLRTLSFSRLHFEIVNTSKTIITHYLHIQRPYLITRLTITI
jgi:hypothetical protein